MHIVYIHQHFCTNDGASGTRSFDVSRHLAQMGHEVTVITGLLDVGGLKPLPWYRLFRRERMAGFDVVVCNVPYGNALNATGRLWAFCWFAVLASIAGAFVRRPDLIFATHTPLTVGIAGYLASRIRRVPFVFEVRDLWPEAFVISGELKGGIVLMLMSALERFIYAAADKILLVSPGFENRLLERGYRPAKLKTIPLGADEDLFRDARADETFRRRHNVEGKMLAVFTGAHGWSNGLDYVLDAAGLLSHRDDIAIIFLGEGRDKARLKHRASQEGLTNVLFLDAVPKTDLPGILMACDVGLMILIDVGRPRPVMPNKIFDYMFCGLPSIVNFDGPTLEMVRAAGAGVGCDPKVPSELAARLEYWADHPDERRAMGAAARRAAFANYTRRGIAEQLAATFEQVLRGRKGR